MTSESESFKFSNIKRAIQKSDEVSSSRQAKANNPNGISSLEVTCKSCSNNWIAGKHDPLSFEQIRSSVIITCQLCGISENIQVSTLK